MGQSLKGKKYSPAFVLIHFLGVSILTSFRCRENNRSCSCPRPEEYVFVETPKVQTSGFGSWNGGQGKEREGKVGLAKCEICPALSNRRVGLGRSYPRRSAGASPVSSALPMERITTKHVEEAVLRPFTTGTIMPCVRLRCPSVHVLSQTPGFRITTEFPQHWTYIRSRCDN